jgi:dihydrofolate reductase
LVVIRNEGRSPCVRSCCTNCSRSAVDHVAEIKQRDGGDIGIHDSISLADSLLRAGLVDELRLVVAPTIASRGRRLFDDDAPMHRLELGEVERTSAGSLFLTYRCRD